MNFRLLQNNRQQEHIESLESKLTNVSEQLLRLERSVENLSTALMERQFTFLFVEVIVFTIILTVCLGRNRGAAAEHTLEEPTKVVPTKKRGHIRAASLDATPLKDITGTRRQRTDTERTKSGKQFN
jgi:hypothetical protein